MAERAQRSLRNKNCGCCACVEILAPKLCNVRKKKKAVLVGKIRKEEEKNFCRVNIIYRQRRTTFYEAKTSGKWYKIKSDSTPYVQK